MIELNTNTATIRVNPSPTRMNTPPIINLPGDSHSPALSRQVDHDSNDFERNIPNGIESPPLPSQQPLRTVVQGRIQSGNQAPRAPSQSGLFAFRQESLRGHRMVQIPSSEVPELRRALNALRLPTDPDEVVVPVERLDNLEENEQENVPENRQGENRQGEEHHAEEAHNNHEHESEEESVRKLAVSRIVFEFSLNLVLLVVYGLAYLFITGKISVSVLFGAFICFALMYIFILIKSNNFSEKPDKTTMFLSIGNTVSLMLFMLIGYLKTRNVKMPLTPFSLFGFLLVFASCCKNTIDSPNGGKIILLLQKILLWVELFLIALCVDGLELPWGTVFIPVYFALMVLAFSSVLIIIGTLLAFFTILREEGISIKLLVGTIWYFLNTLYTGVWLLLVTMVIQKLDDDGGNLELALQVGICHSGVLFIYTLVLWKELLKFQQFEIQSEILTVDDPQPSIIQEDGVVRPPQITFKAVKDNRTSLVMISPTFYSFFKKHLKQKDKKEVENLKNEAQKAKLEKVRHKLSLAIPYKSADPALTNKVITASANANIMNIGKPVKKHNLDFSDGDIDLKKIPTQAIKKEESNRSNENLCAICFDNVPNAVFMDCGHGGVCYECALENWKKTDNCILCRKKISRILKVVHFKPLKVIKVIESTKKVVENNY